VAIVSKLFAATNASNALETTAAMAYPVIIAARRTPVGKFMGALSRIPATQLGAFAIEAALQKAPAAKAHVDECIMGSVLQAGLGQNPARQAGLKAGLPDSLNAVTVNKVCGSSLHAVMLAAQSIKAGDNKLVIAGGMENMSLAPHMTYLRSGVKYGQAIMLDHMEADGLTCPFEKWGMGAAAEYIAKKHDISRAEQDRYSVQSHHRLAKAWTERWLDQAVQPLTAEQVKGKTDFTQDEGFRADTSVELMAKLKPAFDANGTVTAANASQISDGAAAVIVASEEKAREIGAEPLVRVVDYCTAGVAPKELFWAPVDGISTLLRRNNLTVDQIDLFEINEAFAAQTLANAKGLNIPESKLNIVGGAIAMGHPIGASGARVLVTVIHQMRRLNVKRAVAALCLGGGNAVCMLIER
jgi:acetyl-CoA C-acetyltransferase